ncbi:MAG: aspartate dehydrogenase [Acidimicrobiales bacterium]|nr:MAG: aspartate dehydrogenase [Acidimicrobiales bacterium]
MRPRSVRVAFVGWGAIARTAAELLANSPVEIVAVAVRDGSIDRPDLPAGAQLITEPGELAATAPELVAEAAGRDSVAVWGHVALEAHADYVVSSVSAFADASVLKELREAAASNNRRVVIQPGAVAGVEALAAARLMGIDVVEHRIVKPPHAWLGTPAETLCALEDLTEPEAFFSAPAVEAAAAFPKNANVAMTTALAGIGPDATKITLVADPTASTNRHELHAHGAFGQLDVAIANSPLPANPKSSAMAALSLVRTIENRVNPIVI